MSIASTCLLLAVGPYHVKYLEKTLNNIPQVIKKVFIINDTGENLPKRIYQIKDPRFLIFENKENIGLSKSLYKWQNICFEYDYIFRLDVGDISSINRYQEQINYMEKNKNCVLCSIRSKLKFSQGKYKYSYKNYSNLISKIILMITNPIIHGSVCIRGSYFKKIGGYSMKYSSCQDLELYLKIAKYGEISILENSYHVHHFTQNSTTAKFRKKNYLNSAKIRFKAIKNNFLFLPLLFISSAFYYIRYILYR